MNRLMIVRNEQIFQIIPARIGIRKYVQYFNFCFPESDKFSTNYTLMPSACGTISLSFDGERVEIELWGAALNPFVLGREPGRYKVLVLIKLTHTGLYQLIKVNQMEFVDKRISVKAVDQKLYKDLFDAFMFSESITDMVANLERVLYSRMEQTIVSDAVLNATESILRVHGQVQVGEVAKKVGYSDRQLNRLFQNQIGMNVKNYLRLARFNYVLRSIQLSTSFFSSLSQEAGYYDQAHFDKDFKQISGISPKQYQQNMSDFYYEGSEKANIIIQK